MYPRTMAALASPESIFAAPKIAEVSKGLNKFSAVVTGPKSQGASQAQLLGTGITLSDLEKPHKDTSHYYLHLPICRI